MKKLKRYESFGGVGQDKNYEKEIDKVLDALVEKKILISMLKDTINHVCQKIEKTLPEELEEFDAALQHYDDDVYIRFQSIREKLLDGNDNIKDIIDEVEADIRDIEIYLKEKEE